MNINLENISFIIHLRIDVAERLRNLRLLLSYYNKFCKNTEFIIVNDDAEPDKQLSILHKEFANVKFLFLKNNDVYHRTHCFNQAFKQTTRPIVVAGDTDVIIHPKYIKEAEEIIIAGEYNHVYPYNGLFCWVKEPVIKKFMHEFDISVFELVAPPDHLKYPNYENENILVAHTHSRGGCIMYSSDLYRNINGYNPGFRGWGFEDDEINHRISMLGGRTHRLMDKGAIAWHLTHPNTIRDNHIYYNNNKRICDYVGTLNEQQLREYITTWQM